MSQNIVKHKLRVFKKRYFTNQIIGGSIAFLVFFSITFLFFSLTEGLLWLKPQVKTVLFYVFLTASLLTFLRFIAYPLYKLLTMDKHLSDEDAAKIIGKHFPEIQDKLLNLLQLENLKKDSHSDLLLASIEKKTEELKPYPFQFTIDYKKTLRRARYLLVPAIIALLVFVFNREVLTQGTQRFLKYDKEFVPPPPFQIVFKEKFPEKIPENSDFRISFSVEGEKIPQNLFVFVKFQGEKEFGKYFAEKKSPTEYFFSLQGVAKPFEFFIGNPLHRTPVYRVSLLEKPFITGFRLIAIPPRYTGLKADTLEENIGDGAFLKGTKLIWEVKTTENLKEGFLVLDNQNLKPAKVVGNKLIFKKIHNQKFSYVIRLISRDGLTNPDTIKYKIGVIEDQYPSIQILQPAESYILPNSGIVSIEYEATDDYGFSSLEFFYRISQSDNPNRIQKDFVRKKLPFKVITTNFLRNRIDIDFFSLGIESGDLVEYYLKIKDNDFVGGPKSAISTIRKINYANTEKKYEEFNQGNEKVEASMDSLHKQLEDFSKEIEKFKEKVLQKKNLNFQEQQTLQNNLQQQQEMLNEIEKLQEQMKKNLELAEENSLLSEETQKKMEELQKFLDELKDEELANLLKKMEEELKSNKPPTLEELNKLQDKQELLKQQIEQIMELMKQLQFEMKIDELHDKLSELKEKQDFLREKTEFSKSKEERKQLAEEQKALNKEFEKLQEELKELDSLANSGIKEDVEAIKQKQQEVQQEMNRASQSLQTGGSKKKSSQHQKNASEKMQEMMQQLESMKQKSEMQRDMENYEDMRNLLENILELSFKEEELHRQFGKMRYNNPYLKKVVEEQASVKENFEIVRDSLVALAKRSIQIKSYILKKLKKIDNLLARTTTYGKDRQIYPATITSRETMKELNELANMLVEALSDLQEQIKQQQAGNKACSKPQQGAGQSMRKIAKQQQMLNQLMEQLYKRMQKQGKQNQGQNRQQQGNPKDGNEHSEEYQRLAEKQRQIREQMKELMDRMRENGEKGLGDLSKVMQQMKQTEQELADKIFNEATLKRQQQILDRLLDYDKAMREKDWDKKRKSTTAQFQRFKGGKIPEWENRQELQRNIYRKFYLKYTPFYQNLILNYNKIQLN